MTDKQRVVLDVVEARPGLTAVEIARVVPKLNYDRAMHRLSRMELQGHVRREVGANDGGGRVSRWYPAS